MTQQIDRTTPVVGTAVPAPRHPAEATSTPPTSTLPPWTPTPPQGIRWLDAAAAPGPTPAPRASRSRRWWIAGAVAAVVVAVALVAGLLAAANRTMTVQGTVVVAGSSTLLPGAPCEASVLAERPVSIFGADGLLVGTAPLASTGVAVDQWGSSFPFADACRYSFLLTDVGASDDHYRVGVGSSVAGSTEFTREQLETRGAAITYGG